jgi:hypothetical protein
VAAQGNKPELWKALLELLDDKLQLGLLDHLRRAQAYHFEAETLIIEPGTPEDLKYLSKDAVLQQLHIFAQDACQVEKVKIQSSR